MSLTIPCSPTSYLQVPLHFSLTNDLAYAGAKPKSSKSQEWDDPSSREKFLAIDSDGRISFDKVTSNEIAQFEAYHTTQHHMNNLSGKVRDKVPMGNFPVATQESLSQLREMKRRISKNRKETTPPPFKEEEHFTMDVEGEEDEGPRSRKGGCCLVLFIDGAAWCRNSGFLT